MCGKHPLYDRSDDFVCKMVVRKSHICVMKVGNVQPSSCPLIIKGIKSQQQIDLCTGHCSTNLTLIDTDSDNGPVQTNGKVSNYLFSYLVKSKFYTCGYTYVHNSTLLVMG